MTVRRIQRSAFSLIELLVSLSILLVIMVLVSTMLDEIGSGWTRVRNQSIEFRDARTAFETIANRLSQARIDTYWDYDMNDAGIPENYKKASHLHFVAAKTDELVPSSVTRGIGHSVFFEAPFGMSRQSDLNGFSSLLNGWGYFTGFGGNASWQPAFLRGVLAEEYRFRLFEYHLPTEKLILHSETADGITGYEWITDQIDAEDTVSILAENVIAFVVLPLDSLEPDEIGTLARDYRFDSRSYELSPGDSNATRAKHEVPPIIRLTMVVVSGGDFIRFQDGGTGIPPVFDTAGIAPFERADDYEKDLAALEVHLQENRIDYRVFSTAISLRSAKWTNLNVAP